MYDGTEIKNSVKEKYARIANRTSRTSCGCCTDEPDYVNISEQYNGLVGYVEGADLGLGCGLPTQFADIRPGDTVVDLGSGAGNDVFIARNFTGDTGKVIGVDMTEAMIQKAIANNRKLGYANVEFMLGDIESIPLPAETADVVVSNCVINLVPDKTRAFTEIYRVLKAGGHFCISDLVTKGNVPDRIRSSMEAYAGCIAGALDRQDYLEIIQKAGFYDIQIKKSRKIDMPDAMLNAYLTRTEKMKWEHEEFAIYSITVTAVK